MKRFFYKLWSKFLTAFGNIRLSKYIPWIYYDTSDPKVTGETIMKLIDILEPGDIVLRGWDSYLDSMFIRGDYSHAGIYIGNNMIVHAVSPTVCKTSIIDFSLCDRVCVIRPNKYNKTAVKIAKQFVKDKIPYDFDFCINDSNALFCFELAVRSYPKIKFQSFKISKFFGLIKKNVYFADSFRLSKDAKLVFEYNPKRCTFVN